MSTSVVSLDISRYAGERIVLVVDGTTTRQVPEVRTPLRHAQFRSLLHYVVVTGDHLDALAMRYLGDSRLWWVLADVNADKLVGVLGTVALVPGMTLLIPAKDSFVVAGQR